MNKEILKTGVQEFISKEYNTDIVSVLLKKQLFKGVSQKELAEQLIAKLKCKTKLPSWFTTPQIYYPNKLNIEQTSSEQTAQYKAGLVSGKTLLDCTGGLGVDSHFFSKKIAAVIHCELDKNLSKIAAHNSQILEVKNIKFKVTDGVQFLKDSKLNFDWIYLDPSRRNNTKGKVFLLQDCLPNVPLELDAILEKTNTILIKTAPLLDISQGISELKFVKEIHIVAVQNEVKELLWVIEKGYLGAIKICTTNLQKENSQNFNFIYADEKESISTLSIPKTYLYEPNAAILKSGGFKTIGTAFNVQKLHEHAHLYTSNKLITFPGRRFKIEAVLLYSKKELLKLNLPKANITTRNFPESVATIRKKLKIKDGGATYLFFTTNLDKQRIVIKCHKIG